MSMEPKVIALLGFGGLVVAFADGFNASAPAICRLFRAHCCWFEAIEFKNQERLMMSRSIAARS